MVLVIISDGVLDHSLRLGGLGGEERNVPRVFALWVYRTIVWSFIALLLTVRASQQGSVSSAKFLRVSQGGCNSLIFVLRTCIIHSNVCVLSPRSCGVSERL